MEPDGPSSWPWWQHDMQAKFAQEPFQFSQAHSVRPVFAQRCGLVAKEREQQHEQSSCTKVWKHKGVLKGRSTGSIIEHQAIKDGQVVRDIVAMMSMSKASTSCSREGVGWRLRCERRVLRTTWTTKRWNSHIGQVGRGLRRKPIGREMKEVSVGKTSAVCSVEVSSCPTRRWFGLLWCKESLKVRKLEERWSSLLK
jgi:hypothetical protein